MAVLVHVPVLQLVGNDAPQPQTPVAPHVWLGPQVPHVAPAVPQLVADSLAKGSHAVALLQHPPQPLLPLQTHVVPEHTVPAPQTWPQLPQLLLSFWKVKHALPHLVVPAAVQLKVHVIAEHADTPPVGGAAQLAQTPPQSSVFAGH